MAQYDLSSRISQYLDLHLVLPILDFLQNQKVSLAYERQITPYPNPTVCSSSHSYLYYTLARLVFHGFVYVRFSFLFLYIYINSTSDCYSYMTMRTF